MYNACMYTHSHITLYACIIHIYKRNVLTFDARAPGKVPC